MDDLVHIMFYINNIIGKMSKRWMNIIMSVDI